MQLDGEDIQEFQTFGFLRLSLCELYWNSYSSLSLWAYQQQHGKLQHFILPVSQQHGANTTCKLFKKLFSSELQQSLGQDLTQTTEMLVVSSQACPPWRGIRDCLALWQEHDRGDLRIPKQSLPSLSVQVWRAPLATSPALASLVASFQDEECCSRHCRDTGGSGTSAWWQPARAGAEQFCLSWSSESTQLTENPSGRVRLSVPDGAGRGIEDPLKWSSGGASQREHWPKHHLHLPPSFALPGSDVLILLVMRVFSRPTEAVINFSVVFHGCEAQSFPELRGKAETLR